MSSDRPVAVLFDLFGVLTQLQPEEDLRRLEMLAEVHGEAFRSAYWAQRPPYDRGELAMPAYWNAVGAMLRVDFGSARIEGLHRIDLASWNHINEQSVNLVRRLATAGFTLALLSNIPSPLRDLFESKYEWLQLFSVRTYSCDIGIAKPDARAFSHCLRTLGLAAEKVLYIDDRSENVRAARALGFGAVHYSSAAQLERELPGRPA